jgi:two-component system chemotaxis sensor kinase CheA
LNIVIVRGESFRYGIVVDEIMDIEEIVVKKLSRHFKNINYFRGITFLDHGALALILDLASIATMSQIEIGKVSTNNFDGAKESSSFVNMEFMQLNLKKSKNYALPLQIVNRLEIIMTSEVSFCGSIPLIPYRGELLPLLFIERQLKLCSINESLTDAYPESVKVIVVNMHNKRFGIVVDEILDIGASFADIETRNIDRDGFMGTVFIENKMVTIIDTTFLIDNFIEFEKEQVLYQDNAA